MRICQAREQYVRWLLVTRDLSPHTIRAYDGDIVAFERHLGTRALVDEINREQVVAFIEEQRGVGFRPRRSDAAHQVFEGSANGYCRAACWTAIPG